MSVVERVQGGVLGGALRLPVSVKRRLAGPPQRVDGDALDLDVQTVLRMQQVAREPAVETLPLAEGRAALAKQIRLSGLTPETGAVRRLTVDGAEGPLPARLYVPTTDHGAAPAPLLVFFHGGGFIYGDLDTHDGTCRFLAEQAGVRVLAIDYRLSPESPDPGPTLDCAAAYRWALAHAERLGSDPARTGVGGDSAGGYLAAVTAITAAEEGLPCAFQLLLYPLTDSRGATPSRELFAEGYFLTRGFMDLATAGWLGDDADLDDPRTALVLRDLPAGLAPAYVATAGFDPLRDEGEAYAAVLDKAGVPVEVRRFGDQIHGFVSSLRVRSCREATLVVAGALRRGLAAG